jgi:hypothetical protein
MRIKTVFTTLGKIKIRRNRLYDQGEKKYFYPLDEELDICRSQTSKSLARKISLINIFVPFDHGVKFIKELIGFDIPKKILQSVSYRIGATLTKYHQQELTSSENLKLLESNPERVDVEYFLTDGGQTPLLEKVESPELTKSASKAQKKPINVSNSPKKNTRQYRETKFGLFFTNKDVIRTTSKAGNDRVEIKNKRFVASLNHGLDHFKKVVQKASRLHKTFRAKVIVFLSDGSEWCKTIQREVFPGAVRILDFYHATEHLWQAAIIFFGEANKADYTKWAKPLEELLWQGNITKALAIIKDTCTTTRKDQTPLLNLYNYYKGNEDAMRYKEYRDKGYFIGSGAIESTVKYILTTRFKQTGCHWRLDNAESLIWLRCKYFEGRWAEFWDNMNYRAFLKGENVYDLVA